MKKIESVTSMTCEQIQNIWASEPEVLALFDLRPVSDFLENHISGSTHVSLDEIRSVVNQIEDRLAVLICDPAQKEAIKAQLSGRTNYVFMENCEKWLNAENSFQKGKK